MNEYQKQLEEFRLHYFVKYNIKLDDEVLYFFIRVNEMQIDIKRDISKIPKLSFRTKWDYLLHGFGKNLMPGLLFLSICIPLVIVYINKTDRNIVKFVYKNNQSFLEINNGDTLFYMPIKQPE